MLVLITAVLFASQPAEGAAAAKPAATTATSPAAAADARKVCKSIKPTGSRTSTGRVCRTKQEWDRMAEESRSETNRFVNDRSGIAPRDR